MSDCVDLHTAWVASSHAGQDSDEDFDDHNEDFDDDNEDLDDLNEDLDYSDEDSDDLDEDSEDSEERDISGINLGHVRKYVQEWLYGRLPRGAVDFMSG